MESPFFHASWNDVVRAAAGLLTPGSTLAPTFPAVSLAARCTGGVVGVRSPVTVARTVPDFPPASLTLRRGGRYTWGGAARQPAQGRSRRARSVRMQSPQVPAPGSR